ncbi:MAG: hypothetical protein K6U08_02195 [Firmicutes bacterium]|nr:hypothetical protein [Bacillota bacterium]
MTLTTDTQLSVNPTSLTFTKNDWDTWQYVTLTAVEDAVVEGPHSGAVTHTVSSKDKDYDDLTRQLVVTVTDDDSGTIEIRETRGSRRR